MKKLFSLHQQIPFDTSNKRYKMLADRTGRRWFVADVLNAGDYIYLEGDPGGAGSSGGFQPFRLLDGSLISVLAPWLATSSALFQATGHDLRAKCLTRGIIALSIEYGITGRGDTYGNILQYDPEPKIGAFNRIERMAGNYAVNLGATVYFAVVGQHGSHAGNKPPKEGE